MSDSCEPANAARPKGPMRGRGAVRPTASGSGRGGGGAGAATAASPPSRSPTASLASGSGLHRSSSAAPAAAVPAGGVIAPSGPGFHMCRNVGGVRGLFVGYEVFRCAFLVGNGGLQPSASPAPALLSCKARVRGPSSSSSSVSSAARTWTAACLSCPSGPTAPSRWRRTPPACAPRRAPRQRRVWCVAGALLAGPVSVPASGGRGLPHAHAACALLALAAASLTVAARLTPPVAY